MIPGDRTRRSNGHEAALLLLGHGSATDPASARPVRALARDLRDRGAFPEIRVGFWKEAPYFREVLWTVDARIVHVVPVFTSVGHYTRHVIPRELAIDDPSRRPPGMEVHLYPPVGTHPGMADIVLERARPEAEPGSALVIVGHGTPRHPESGRVTHELAASLRGRWSYGPVAAAFLDEEPRVEDVIATQSAGSAVVVPFFISEGWHAGVTLPRSLAVEDGRGRLGETAVRYTSPVGTHPSLGDFILDLVVEP